MIYRNFPGMDWKPSALGFGAMRLPLLSRNPADVDYPQAVNMIRYAVDNGVNYLDTAYFYHSGNSEKAVGMALQDGYRQKIKLATKFPAREVNSPADFDGAFQMQLERLQTDKVDFYLLHGLHRAVWDRLQGMGVLNWLEKQKSAGRISHLGFSFHDDFTAFKQVVDAWDNWEFCQIHYNYMDEDYQAGRSGLDYAASKNLGVIVMEPLRGGQLAGVPPQAVADIWKFAQVQRSPVEWAFRWVWSQPQVSFLLSGMSSMAQVMENVDIAARAGNSSLNQYEKELIDRVKQAYRSACPVPCTACRYCMPCPNGVEIPAIFRIFGEMKMYNDINLAKMRYNGGIWGLNEKQHAGNCIECNHCLELCPQHINIPEWLKKAHSELKN
ncbi:MAG TPA: aldo/keto reductase [Dehalococcoidales bacterium]|nr:aldo/keto reductase [Dehalococcoidales bacterium]